MAAEFYVVFGNPDWYENNRATIKKFILSLITFKKNINDQEYWLRGNEPGGDWDYGARIFIRPQDILVEISGPAPSIVNDIINLKRLISENTNCKVVDEDGVVVDCYN